MSAIDNRIVDMQFNNQQFETGIKDSLTSIDNLKKGLDGMDGASKGLEQVGDSANKMGLNFSAMEVMAVTAIVKLTDAIIDLGLQAANFLIFEQFTAGFTKYEQQIEAVQTIMNATGKGIEEVTGYMDQLMWFTDETSYRYMDMVRNIGKFTSAGVELSVATEAMQGISVWAALSGKGIQGAETAMESLSVSIGKGAVKLQEWRRLEQANMGTMEFKQVVLDSAVALGTLTMEGEKYIAKYVDPLSGKIKPMEVSLTDFGTALKAGWFNSEVLLESLGKYGGYSTIVAQASEEMGITAIEAMRRIDEYADGTAASMENLGDLSEDVRAQIDALGNETLELGRKAFKAAQESKTLSDVMNFLGDAISTSWMQTFDIIIGNFDEAVSMWSDLAEVLYDVFVESGNVRNEMLGLWKEMGGRDVLLEGITNIGRLLLDVLEAVGEAWGNIFPPMAAETLFEMTEKFRDFTERIQISEETSDKLRRTFEGLFAAIDLVRRAFSTALTIVGKVIQIFLPFTSNILDATAGLGDFIVNLRDSAIEGKAFEKVLEVVGKVLDTMGEMIHNAADYIKLGIDKLKDFFSQFGGIDLGPLKIFGEQTEEAFRPLTAIANLFKKAWETIVKVFEWAVPIVIPFAKQVGQALVEFGKKIGEFIRSGDLKGFLDLINTGLIGGVILGIKKFVDSLTDLTTNGGDFIGKVTGLLDGVRGSLEAYQSKIKADALIKIAGAIAILVGALWVLSGIEGKSLVTGLAAIGILLGELSFTLLALGANIDKMNTVKMGAIAITIVAIAGAILILSTALKKLENIDWADLIKGGVGVYALSEILVKVADELAKNSGKLTSGGLVMIEFATAIIILTSAVEKLGLLDVDVLIAGLAAVGVVMYELVSFSQMVKPEGLQSTGAAMIAMAVALNIMAIAVRSLGNLDVDVLIAGLAAVGAVLMEMAAFSQMVKPEKLEGVGLAMVVMGAGLLIISKSVKMLGSLDLDVLFAGLTAVGVILMEIASFTDLVNSKEILSTASAMVAIGAALLIIATSVKSLGSMNMEQLAKGLGSLATILTMLVIAMNEMENGIEGAGAMIIMAAAILILASAVKSLGSMSVSELVIALIALGGAFVILGVAASILGPLTTVILALAGAITLLGVGILGIGAGVLAFSTGLATLAAVGSAAAATLIIVVTSLLELIPLALEKLGEGIVAFAGVIAKGTPAIMQAITAVVKGLIDIITKMIPDVVVAILVFVNSMLSQLAAALPQMIQSGMDIIIALLTGIRNNIAEIVTVVLEIIAEFIRGIADGIDGIVESGKELIRAILKGIGEMTLELVAAAGQVIVDFINGLATEMETLLPDIIKAFKNLGGAIVKGVVDGITGGKGDVKKASNELADVAESGFKEPLEIHSPSKVFEEAGEDITEGLVDGIEEGSKSVGVVTAGLGQLVTDTFKHATDPNVFFKMGANDVESFIAGLNSRGEIMKETLTAVYNIPTSEAQEAAMKGMDEAQKKIYKQSIADQEASLKELTDIVDNALTTIENRIESYTDAATNRMSVMNVDSEVSVEEMISNMEKNQQILTEWADGIATLADRGINQGLLETLRSAGPSSAGEVKNLVNASDEQLQRLNEVFSNGGTVATYALVTSIGEAQPAMVAEGQNIVDAVAQGITSDTSLNEAMGTLLATAKAEAEAAANPDDFMTIGTNIIGGLTKGIDANTGQATASITTMSEGLLTSAREALGIHSPSTMFMEIGDYIMQGLAEGITANITKPIAALSTIFAQMATSVTEAAISVTTAALTGLSSNAAEYGLLGGKYGLDFSNNLSNQQINSMIAGQMVSLWAEIGLKSNQAIFGTTGSKDGEDFSNQLSNKSTDANAAGIKVAVEALKGLIENAKDFYTAGENAGQGFANGLLAKIGEVTRAARKVAAAANEAFEDELDIHSPSRVFYSHGENTGLGFINGLLSMTKDVANSASNLGSSAIDGIKTAIGTIVDTLQSDLDMSPVITPVVDLSNAKQDILSFNKSIGSPDFTTTSRLQAEKVNALIRSDSAVTDEGTSTTTSGNTYNFTQNNTSPKALNRLEIYRQTKNQFAQMKGLVEGV